MASEPAHMPSASTPTNSPQAISITTPDSIRLNPASNQSIIDATVDILAQQLEHEWKRQRAPQGLKKKLFETRTSGTTITTRIFLDHGGFRAWIAYFLATEGKVHFKGRHERAVTLTSFQTLPTNDQIDGARRVAAIRAHPTVDLAIQKISAALQSGGFLQPPSENIAVSPAVLTSFTSTPPPPIETQTHSAISGMSPNAAHFIHHHQHMVLEQASLQGIGEIFDDYICGAVRRDTVHNGGRTYRRAAVTMDFPFRGLVDCLMSLAIHKSKVEHLAMALFKVHVESVGQGWCVFLKEGARLIPNSEITLKGALDEAVVRIFGPEIHQAIAASRMRKKELEEGNHATECVSMILISGSDAGAIINLSMGLRGGSKIQNKLYT